MGATEFSFNKHIFVPLIDIELFSGTNRVLPDGSSLSTQADLNSWVIASLEALDADGALSKLKVRPDAPATPHTGELWFDTSTDELKVWDAFNWKVAINLGSTQGDLNALTNQVAAQDTANATRFTNIENSVAALPLNSYALATTLETRANTLQSNIDSLTTNIGDLNRFALAADLTNTVNSHDTRLTALESVNIDLTPYATSADVTTEVATANTDYC